MTVLVSVKINDGVVMAADSASSFCERFGLPGCWDVPKKLFLLRGTDGSNPSPSRGESSTNLDIGNLAASPETPPPPPFPGYAWDPGHWAWDGAQYVWEPGRYIVQPTNGATFTPGYWQQYSGGWAWVDGRWSWGTQGEGE
jgi:hypothetical protein